MSVVTKSLAILRISSVAFTAVIIVAPATADTRQPQSCDESITVDLVQWGKMDKTTLEKEIDRIKHQLKLFRHGRGPRLSYNRRLKRELSTMQEAKQDLLNRMYVSGCSEERADASIEAQIKVLEKQLEHNR